MKTILNNSNSGIPFYEAVRKLAENAKSLDIAVSYVQMSGWQLLERIINEANVPFSNVRILCTDQMSITQPSAIVKAIEAGVIVRNFGITSTTFHPKVYLAYSSQRRPSGFIVGSANISYSAYKSGEEAGISGVEPDIQKNLGEWFEKLFLNKSVAFTHESLREAEEIWRQTALTRSKARLRVNRPELQALPQQEDFEILEDVFASVVLPLGLLQMDYAGNNIRRVGRVRQLLLDWEKVKAGKSNSKARSELKLLGFADGSELTELGVNAQLAKNEQELAHLWFHWLKNTPKNILVQRNGKLLAVDRVFRNFWSLRPSVRNYFLSNVENGQQRKLLQCIEILCNAMGFVDLLELEDFRGIANAIFDERSLDKFPGNVRSAIDDYLNNKGTRGWDSEDCKILPEAWRRANPETLPIAT